MKTIKIGNDLPIAWTVLRCGSPEDFSGKGLSLYMTSRYGRIPVPEYTVNGNIIKFVYHGRDQKYPGEYGLLLIENDDKNGMYTIDAARAFALVLSGTPLCECSSEVHLISDIAVPANGLSAYEIAVLHGYIGTEEEWLAQMSNLPLKPGTGRGSLMHVQAYEATGSNSFAEGTGAGTAGSGSHAEGKDSRTGASAHHAHAEGLRTLASQQQAHAEGAETSADGTQAHAEGYFTHANGHRSHAEGQETRADGKGAHAEGYGTVAIGEYSHSEGNSAITAGASSHAEGVQTKAISSASHAEGRETTAFGTNTHAEGFKTRAAGYSSHAEGQETEATAPQSHAEGLQTLASGDRSHAEGYKTITNNKAEHAEGTFNLSIPGKTIHTVGIGLGDDSRMNAEEIHTDGKQYIIGVGGYDGTNSTDEGTKSVQDVINGLQTSKQDRLSAGRGIQIDGNTIDCTLDTGIFKVVDTLPDAPATGDENKIHLVPSATTETGNIYTEYIFSNGKWEKLGEFQPAVDLSNYVDRTSNQTIAGEKRFTSGRIIITNETDTGSAYAAIYAKKAIKTKRSVVLFSGPGYPIRLSGVDSPIEDGDVATKGYVDRGISNCHNEINKLLERVTELETKMDQIIIEVPYGYESATNEIIGEI